MRSSVPTCTRAILVLLFCSGSILLQPSRNQWYTCLQLPHSTPFQNVIDMLKVRASLVMIFRLLAWARKVLWVSDSWSQPVGVKLNCLNMGCFKFIRIQLVSEKTRNGASHVNIKKQSNYGIKSLQETVQLWGRASERSLHNGTLAL